MSLKAQKTSFHFNQLTEAGKKLVDKQMLPFVKT